MRCPKCHHLQKQRITKQCENCGIWFEKYERQQTAEFEAVTKAPASGGGGNRKFLIIGAAVVAGVIGFRMLGDEPAGDDDAPPPPAMATARPATPAAPPASRAAAAPRANAGDDAERELELERFRSTPEYTHLARLFGPLVADRLSEAPDYTDDELTRNCPIMRDNIETLYQQKGDTLIMTYKAFWDDPREMTKDRALALRESTRWYVEAYCDSF